MNKQGEAYKHRYIYAKCLIRHTHTCTSLVVTQQYSYSRAAALAISIAPWIKKKVERLHVHTYIDYIIAEGKNIQSYTLVALWP